MTNLKGFGRGLFGGRSTISEGNHGLSPRVEPRTFETRKSGAHQILAKFKCFFAYFLHIY